MIKELTTLIANNTSLVRDTDLFAGHRTGECPDSCDVLLERSPSDANGYLTDKVNFMLQVISRAGSYFVARARAYVIYDFLHTQTGVDLPVVTSGDSYVLMFCQAVDIPQSIGVDDKGREEFSTNYVCRIRNK